LWIVNIRLGQNLQPLQLRQKERVVLIVGVLEAVVLLDLGRIGQVNRVNIGSSVEDARENRHGTCHLC